MIVVQFPDPAPRLNMNDRTHWRPYAIRKKHWRHAAKVHGRIAAVTGFHNLPHPPCDVQLVLGVPDPGRRRDPSNWTPTAKAIVDGLVDAGYWPDDNSDWVTILEPRFVKGTGVRIELTPRQDTP